MALVDRYEILRHLGQGACGDVYLVRDRLLSGRDANPTTAGEFDQDFVAKLGLGEGFGHHFDAGELLELREERLECRLPRVLV